MNKNLVIEPSILAGDFGALAQEAKRAELAGADALHVDVMDGHFVPNFSLGPRALAAINRATSLFLDVHVMIYNPFSYIERFVEAGADRITFHFEATEDVAETLKFVRRCGIEAGLAFCPETSPEMVTRYVDQCDLILLMTVEPGFGGQSFLPSVMDKVRFVRTMCETRGLRKGGTTEKSAPPFAIQVDGGVTDQTAPLCIEAGANVIVAGSYLYNAPDMRAAIDTLRQGGPR